MGISKIRTLNGIGGHYADILAKSFKSGESLRGTGDNWDISVMSSDMSKSIPNKSMHLFAPNSTVNRLSLSHLDNKSPKYPITNTYRGCFFRNSNKLKTLRKNFKILAGRICFQFLTKFKFLKSMLHKVLNINF